MVRAYALLAFVLMVAGCGGLRTTTETATVTETVPRTTTITVPARPISATSTSCVVYNHDDDAAVRVLGNGALATCDAIIKKWSDSFSFWSYNDPAGPDGEHRDTVCELVSGSIETDVLDVGSHMEGHRLCGELVSRGFVER